MKFGAVVLAAGYSSRMKGFKPLMSLGEESLIARTIKLFTAVGIEKTVVVVGYRNAETTIEVKRYGADPCFNPRFDNGMFSSVCIGLSQLTDCDGFFMLPVDIPLVRPSTIQTLISSFDHKNILHPYRDGLRGYPLLIPSHLISEILDHNGKGGLKKVLKRHPAKEIKVWDDGPFMGADTSEEFVHLINRLGQIEVGSRKEAETAAALFMSPKGVAHGRAVAKIACKIAKELNKKGFSIDQDIVFNGGLLHDIGKGHPRHEEYGAKMMHDLGLNALAEVIGAHRDAMPVAAKKLSAKEIVCLADKLVRGKDRVAVGDRFEEKLIVYKDDKEACKTIKNRLNNALKIKKTVEKAASKSLAEIVGNV